MRLRHFGAMALSAVVAIGLAPAAQAHSSSTHGAVPRAATPGTSPTEFYFASGAGDYIGSGATVDYTDPSVSLTASSVSASVGGWDLSLGVPAGQTLAVGTYTESTTASTGSIELFGNGRGCDQYYGTFTVYEVTATSFNATFSQTCESTTAAPLVGFIRYNATLTTPVPTLPSTALPITPPPNSGSTSANADEFSFLSAAGDYIGGGTPADYVGPSNVVASGDLGTITVDAGDWTLNLSAPSGQQLVPGTYTGATRYPFNTSPAPGISVYGDGRGCNEDFGTFTIYQIASDPTGVLTQLNATFNQTCESTTAPPLAGFIRYNATVPTPVPTIPAPPVPLSAQLAPSAGAANADGTTVVTLDASGSTGTDSNASYSFDFGDGAAATTSASPIATRPEYEGTYEVTVTITDGSDTSTSAPQWLTVGAGYHALSPVRLLDTRYGIGGPTHSVASMSSITLQLPSSVTASGHGPLSAVVLNVTVTQPTAAGDIKVYPYGVPQPATSNLNYVSGETVANLVTVPMASIADGKVVLYVHSAGSAELIADLEGYYTDGNDPTNAGYAPLTPTRIMDTRYGVGHTGKVGAYGTVALPVPASIPANATALVMNVTAVNTTSTGDLKVYPAGGSGVPNVSNLNFAAKQIVPNLVIVPISAARTVDFYLESHGSADLIADLEGYFSPTATSKFVAYYPTRLFDTRTEGAAGALPGGYAITAPMAYALDVPVSALTASLYNVTVTQPQGPGFITVFPDGLQAVPNVSNLNFVTNETVPNAVLASMTDGDQDFYNGGSKPTQLIVDFFGYFAKPLATDAPPTAPEVDKRSAAVTKRVVRAAL